MRRTDLDRRLKAEARAAKLAGLTRAGRLRRRLGWPFVAVGVTWFSATFIANYAGFILLPFDQHHFIGQAGGVILTVTGLNWATA